MSSEKLIRLCGIAMLLAGALSIAGALTDPGDAAAVQGVTTRWVAGHTFILCALTLNILGLIGLYYHLRDSGALGFLGFIFTFIGMTWAIGAMSYFAFIHPVVAAMPEASTTLLAAEGPLYGGPLRWQFLIAFGSYVLGYVLLGIALLRSRVLPRWAGLLLIIGAPLLSLSPPLPEISSTVGAIILGAASLWLGYVIWSGPEEAAA